MGEINPIIPENFSKYASNNPDFPDKMLKLLKDLLAIESRSSIEKESVDRLYEKVLSQYADDNILVNWCKNYVGDN
jgi:hypothetical protein